MHQGSSAAISSYVINHLVSVFRQAAGTALSDSDIETFVERFVSAYGVGQSFELVQKNVSFFRFVSGSGVGAAFVVDNFVHPVAGCLDDIVLADSAVCIFDFDTVESMVLSDDVASFVELCLIDSIVLYDVVEDFVGGCDERNLCGDACSTCV
jgi:hypothetical protein